MMASTARTYEYDDNLLKDTRGAMQDVTASARGKDSNLRELQQIARDFLKWDSQFKRPDKNRKAARALESLLKVSPDHQTNIFKLEQDIRHAMRNLQTEEAQYDDAEGEDRQLHNDVRAMFVSGASMAPPEGLRARIRAAIAKMGD